MRRKGFAAQVLCASVLLGPLSAAAAPAGTRIPFTATAVEDEFGFQVQLYASPTPETIVDAEAGGPLPITIPFSLTNPPCTATGSATAAVVNEGLQVDLSGVSLSGDPLGCELQIDLTPIDLSLEVPEVGDATTPVFFSIGYDMSGTGDQQFENLRFALPFVFESTLMGRVAEIPINGGGVWLDTIGSQPSPPSSVSSQVRPFVPADSIVFSPWVPELEVRIRNSGAAGTFSASARVDALLPLSVSPPAPSLRGLGRAALAAMLVVVAGLGFARRARRIGPREEA